MKDYDRNEIITKLCRNGFKPIYNKKSNTLKHFKKPRNRVVGIKCLGYLDFLRVSAI